MTNPNEDGIDKLDASLHTCINVQMCRGLVTGNVCWCDEKDKIYTIGKRKTFSEALEKYGEARKPAGGTAFITPVAAKVWMKCVGRQMAIFLLEGKWTDSVKWDDQLKHYVTTRELKMLKEAT